MTADEVKQLLQLQPLAIEGGFFRETYRSRCHVAAEYLPAGIRGPRSIGTAIYYMITPETFSPLHRLPGAEIFHFYLGDAAIMLQLLPDGSSQTMTMGSDLPADSSRKWWSVAECGRDASSYLAASSRCMGTTMSPGFDYADYENGDREQLIAQYPNAAEDIRQYTR